MRSTNHHHRALSAASLFLAILASTSSVRSFADEIDLKAGLVAHWPLADDGRDAIAGHIDANSNVEFETFEGRKAAAFNGIDSVVSVPARDKLSFGAGEFSIAAWVNVETAIDDAPGDLVSQYNAAEHRGFHLALKTNSGVTTTQPNWRQLQFAIDNNRAENEWRDHGRPGNALLAFALALHDGSLYAGVCQPGEKESGRVYRLEGTDQWVDSGAPDGSNSVTALTVFEGKLYAATGKYRVAGSALPESPNLTLGGKVFRHEGDSQWTDCGQLPGVEAIGGLVVFRGKLYASSLYKPAGFFRYKGEQSWTDCIAGQQARVEALCVYNGRLYATSYDGGKVYRFDGERWDDCGQLGADGQNTQTYAFAIHHGRLYAGTWPSGRVYRFDDVGEWADCGRLGEELEVMGMMTHNGRLIAGSLPLAQVYEYEAPQTWKLLAQLDETPDVKYRRAWTMAEHDGRLFVSTLPSGRIYSYSVGRMAMSGRALPSGWRHVTAVKLEDRLKLYVYGKLEAVSAPFESGEYDLSSTMPLRIGAGPNDFFRGRLADVRLYSRALNESEIVELAK